MYGFINKILGIVICLIMILVMLSTTVVTNYLQSSRSVIAEVTNMVDEVTDTGKLSEQDLSDFYIACNSHGIVTDVVVTRYVKVVNPNPSTTDPDDTIRTYVVSDDIHTWQKGDLIQINAKCVGTTGMMTLVYHIFGLSTANLDFTLSGRIR